MAAMVELQVRIDFVNWRTVEKFADAIEAAESLMEDLPWRDEPKRIVDGLRTILDEAVLHEEDTA